jgi:hypothetical protein
VLLCHEQPLGRRALERLDPQPVAVDHEAKVAALERELQPTGPARPGKSAPSKQRTTASRAPAQQPAEPAASNPGGYPWPPPPHCRSHGRAAARFTLWPIAVRITTYRAW